MADMATETPLTSAQLADLNARRRGDGTFGDKQQTAASSDVLKAPAEKPKTDRQRRLAQLHTERNGLAQALRAADRRVRDEAVAEMWAQAPSGAEVVRFEVIGEESSEWVSFNGFYDTDGEVIEADEAAEEFEELARNFDPDDCPDHFEEVKAGFGDRYFTLDVSKTATRERIAQLQDEWKKSATGRSSKLIGDDIDTAATRIIEQVAAEQGWASVELDWEEGGRSGLTLKSVTKGGKTYKAGSGDMDDHEAIWAAAQFDTPTLRMTAEHGALGPFTLNFEQRA